MLSSHLEENFALVSTLQENFRGQLGALARKVVGNDEQVKYEALVQINGYIRLLGPKASTLIDTSIEHLSLGILKMLSFDYSSVHLVEDRLVATARPDVDRSRLILEPPQLSGLSQFPKKSFVYFREERTLREVSQLCRLLGYFGNAAFLVDHFSHHLEAEDTLLDTSHAAEEEALPPSRQRTEIIFLLNELLLGMAAIGVRASFEDSDTETVKIAPRASQPELRSLSLSLLQIYLDSPAWFQPTNNIDAEAYNDFQRRMRSTHRALFQQYPVERLNNNILQLTLLLEGVANISRIHGRQFRNQLMDSLYPVLETYEDANRMVHEAASVALSQLADSCGYGGVPDMILDNVDYVVNGASSKLRHFTLNPSVPRVLCAAIRQVGAPIIPFLEDSVDEVFDALDQYHDQFFVCWSLIKGQASPFSPVGF